MPWRLTARSFLDGLPDLSNFYCLPRQSRGISFRISAELKVKVPRRTLQRHLARLIHERRLRVEGRARGSRYCLLPVITVEANLRVADATVEAGGEIYVPISPAAEVSGEPSVNRHRAATQSGTTTNSSMPIDPTKYFISPRKPDDVCSNSAARPMTNSPPKHMYLAKPSTAASRVMTHAEYDRNAWRKS